jgi:hypothetical protein
MEKQLGNSGKRKKPFWPKPAHQAQTCAPAPACLPPLTGGPCLSAPYCPALFSLSRSLPSGAELSAPVPFAPVPLFPHCLAGPVRQSPSRYPPCPFSLSLRRGPALSAPPSPRPPWTSARALTHVAGILDHDASPRAPAPFLSPAHAHTHSPASIRTAPPSLALCSRRQTSPETRASLLGHLARRRPRQATLSSALR